MNNNLSKLAHNKYLDARIIDRIVNSLEFSEALLYDESNWSVEHWIRIGDHKSLEAWIKATLIREIGEMSMRELRALAAKTGIPNYCALSKDQLIIRISNDRRAKKVAQ